MVADRGDPGATSSRGADRAEEVAPHLGAVGKVDDIPSLQDHLGIRRRGQGGPDRAAGDLLARSLGHLQVAEGLQAAGFKVYKSTEPFGPNTLYVVQVDPTVPNSEYELFSMLQKTMTPEELRAPETQEMWKKYAAAFAAGLSKLSLTPIQ